MTQIFLDVSYGHRGLLSHLQKLNPNIDVFFFFLFLTFNNQSFSTELTVESFAHRGREQGKLYITVHCRREQEKDPCQGHPIRAAPCAK